MILDSRPLHICATQSKMWFFNLVWISGFWKAISNCTILGYAEEDLCKHLCNSSLSAWTAWSIWRGFLTNGMITTLLMNLLKKPKELYIFIHLKKPLWLCDGNKKEADDNCLNILMGRYLVLTYLRKLVDCISLIMSDLPVAVHSTTAVSWWNMTNASVIL